MQTPKFLLKFIKKRIDIPAGTYSAQDILNMAEQRAKFLTRVRMSYEAVLSLFIGIIAFFILMMTYGGFDPYIIVFSTLAALLHGTASNVPVVANTYKDHFYKTLLKEIEKNANFKGD